MTTHFDTIQELRDVDLTSYPETKVLEMVRGLDKIGTYVACIRPGVNIYRLRFGGWYDNPSEISYNPVCNCKKANRASLRGETVFYGIVSDDEDPLSSAEYIGISECSSILHEPSFEASEELFTCGVWQVNEPFPIICIANETCFQNAHRNPLLMDIKQNYAELKPSNEYFNAVKDFLCEEFSKEVNRHEDFNYLISAAYTHRVLELNYANGVMYPPVRTNGNAGMNVALNHNLVDRHIIQLSGIIHSKFVCCGKIRKVTNYKYITL